MNRSNFKPYQLLEKLVVGRLVCKPLPTLTRALYLSISKSGSVLTVFSPSKRSRDKIIIAQSGGKKCWGIDAISHRRER